MFLTLVFYFLTFVTSCLCLVPEKWDDYKWSVLPDPTADEYRDAGLPLPKVADPITTVEEGRSYVIKLNCPGCPFILREMGQTQEAWQNPAPENSLLLNFTVDSAAATLFLNGKSALPLASMPNLITAYQAMANVSAATTQEMIKTEMLDESWQMGTKYGTFDLSYEHTQLVATEEPLDDVLQFDVIAICSQGQNSVCTGTGAPGMKMVQILLHHSFDNTTGARGLEITDVDLVERGNGMKPIKMPSCGKDALIKTVFRSFEYDRYGHFGTWTRMWHYVMWNLWDGIASNGLILIVLTVVFGGYFSAVHMARRRARRARRAQRTAEDAEVALLAEEGEEESVILGEEESAVVHEEKTTEVVEKEVLLAEQV